MAEVIINDSNYMQFVNPVVDGETKKMGLIPRDYQQCPVGYLACAKPFDLPLIPESEWEDRLQERIKAKAQLSDIRNRGIKIVKDEKVEYKPIPSRDQDGKGYCVTEDTEIMTEKGFVPYPDYNWSDLLGTVNPVTGGLEFQAPLKKHVYEYKGPMIYSNNRRIDFGVTPDHRMLVRKWDERNRTLSDSYSFQRAAELGWYLGLMPAPLGYRGTELVELEIPGDRCYDGDDLLALLALVVSDGFAGGSNSTEDWVSFCCFHPKLRPKVAALAARVGFHAKPSDPNVFCRYDSGALSTWIRANCYTSSKLRAQTKKIPDIVKCASTRQIKHFLQYFGDQNHTGQKRVFYSTSKRLIDDLQELHLRVGKRGTISERGPRTSSFNGVEIKSGKSYTLCVGQTDRLCIDKKKHIETESYKGLVYCATVPNGTLITRRNGSVLISGNCWAHSSTSAVLILRALENQPYSDLSAFAVACIIKHFRDEGGWGSQSLEFIAERGIPSSEFWPQQSMKKENDNSKTWENAALHKVTEWMDMEPRSKNQLVTCLLSGIPVVSDFNWWGHSVCSIDLVSIKPFRTRIWNSWGDGWSDNGTGLLEGSKAIPDGMIAPRVISPATK